MQGFLSKLQFFTKLGFATGLLLMRTRELRRKLMFVVSIAAMKPENRLATTTKSADDIITEAMDSRTIFFLHRYLAHKKKLRCFTKAG